MSGAVVLLSGGQDSTVALYLALQSYERVEAIGIDYGQMNRHELEAALRIAHGAGVEYTTLNVEALEELGESTLTGAAGGEWHDARGLPRSFVPGRNIVFFALGAAYGIPRGLETLVVGCSNDDVSPDGQPAFLVAFEATVRVGMRARDFAIWAPLLHKTKADVWRTAADMRIDELLVDSTITCYDTAAGPLHPWGYGCGECAACVKRARGYSEAFAA